MEKKYTVKVIITSYILSNKKFKNYLNINID
jgi:hypothetical protein